MTPQEDESDDLIWSRVYPTGVDTAFSNSLSDLCGLDEDEALTALNTLDDYIQTPNFEIGQPAVIYRYRVTVTENYGTPEVSSRRMGNLVIELRKLLKFETIDPLLLGVELAQKGVTPELFIFRAVWTLWNGSKATLPPEPSHLFVLLARKANLPCETKRAFDNVQLEFNRVTGKPLDADWFQETLTEFSKMGLVEIESDILSIPERIIWKMS